MKKISLFILFLIASVTAIAQQVDFTIIPPRNVVAGDRFRVAYRLSNAEGNSLQAPQIDGCTLLYGPSTSTSFSTQIINGRQSSSSTIDYVYTYQADNEGTFTIPSASINVDGKTLRAEAKQFKVLPPDKNRPQSQNAYPQQQYPSQQSVQPQQSSTSKISSDDIFVRVILNKSTAYEHEAVECTLKLYTKYEAISSFNSTSLPTFEGFLIEEVDVKAELNQIEHYNGQNYRTAILKKYILYPQKTGKLTVNSGAYDIVVQQLERISQGFFYITRPVEQSVHLADYKSTLNVTPLPTPQPEGFNNAVGNFSITDELPVDAMKTGEAATLTLNVSGSGNIKFIKEPTIEFPDEFELYPVKNDVNASVSGATMKGQLTCQYTFVPQYPGNFTIPAVKFVYFNPADKEYHTLTTQPHTISVAKGANTISSPDSQGLKAKAEDIRYIRTGNKNLSKSHSYLASSSFYWIAYGILTAILISVLILYRKQLQRKSDVAGMRISKAGKVARKRLKAADNCIKEGKTDAFYGTLLQAIWGYVGDKFSLNASTLTRDNISEQLSAHGASESLISEIINLIDDCEMARYTPNDPSLSPDQLMKKAQALIQQIETITKK